MIADIAQQSTHCFTRPQCQGRKLAGMKNIKQITVGEATEHTRLHSDAEDSSNNVHENMVATASDIHENVDNNSMIFPLRLMSLEGTVLLTEVSELNQAV